MQKLAAAVLLALLLASTPLGAAEAKRIALLADAAAGTDAIAPPGSTAAIGERVAGGWAVFHLTCYVDATCTAAGVHGESTAACCTGSGTGTCGQWPESVALEARPSDALDWQAVDGFTAPTAADTNNRQGVFWFAPGEWARISITDSAGTHACTALLAFTEEAPT